MNTEKIKQLRQKRLSYEMMDLDRWSLKRDQDRVDLEIFRLENEDLRAQVKQQDSDWLAMLRAIAKIADKMEADKAEPDNAWSEADEATLMEQFDPWQTLREVEAALEQAAPVSAWEQPDWDDAPSWSNWWTVEPDGNINWHENEPQVVFYYWLNEGRMQRVAGGFIDIPIGTDWRQLKAQRPATAAGEEVT